MAATVQPCTVRLATIQLRSGPDNSLIVRHRVRTVSTSASSGNQRSSSTLLKNAYVKICAGTLKWAVRKWDSASAMRYAEFTDCVMSGPPMNHEVV